MFFKDLPIKLALKIFKRVPLEDQKQLTMVDKFCNHMIKKLKDKILGETVYAILENNYDLVKENLLNGIDANSVIDDWWEQDIAAPLKKVNLLHFASFNLRAKIAKLLIDHGAIITTTDRDSKIAADWASRSNHVKDYPQKIIDLMDALEHSLIHNKDWINTLELEELCIGQKYTTHKKF